ncbi:MAG TPA: GPW/gp25 family protein [Actinomycetota bacterium]|nr:GPW/gp25 family protein [Actinomycetota bacterium]
MTPDLVGAGWGFPLRTDHTGGIRLVSKEREIEEAIRLILATAPGERPMRPEFGCGIHEYVFAPADVATAGRMAFEVKEALIRWEPRIGLDSVDVYPGPAPSTMYIDIRYSIKGSLDPRTLVFPFYMIPAEEG